MTIDEAKRQFGIACNDYMTLDAGIDAPPKVVAKWEAAKQKRNEIYRQFGEQVLDWARHP